jgi:acetyltransferase-like isoleucine patch superfamily enzyme
MILKLLSFSRYPEFVRLAYWRTVVIWRIKKLGVSLQKGVRFFGMPIVTVHVGSSIEIGENASLCSTSYYTALGVNHPIILRTLRESAKIKIGADSGLSGTTICAAVSVTIGSQCLIGANVTIVDNDFHAINPTNRRHNTSQNDIGASPVVIEDNVFIGACAIILKGVTIGKNSVVGAGSVVVSNVPENVVVAGNPAKVIRQIL